MINFNISETEKAGTLILEGELSIQNSEKLKEVLMEAIDNTECLNINIEHLEKIDLACMQLLCSGYESFLKSNKKIILDGPCPEAIKEIIINAGYSSHMKWFL